MFNKLFENPKTRGRNLILCILPFLVCIGLFGFLAIKSVKKIIPGNAVLDSDVYAIKDYNYVLRSNATKYQVELFNQLDDALDGDDEQLCAELIAKNFVADFFTWTNKAGSYDVGGIYFVYSPQRKSIILDARMSFYKYLTYYINKYGNKKLLEVTNVEVTSSSKLDNKYVDNEGREYEGYYVACEWTYNDYSFDSKTNYMKNGYFTVIKNYDGRFEIVEMYGDE